VFPGDKLAARDPIIDDRVVLFQYALELMQFLSGELRETLIGKGAEQQISLACPAVTSAESELATERLERAEILR